MKRPIVLFVDDNDLIRGAVARMIREIATVVVVDSAAEALRVLEQRSFDAILTDFDMPEMDGLSLLEIVRARWPHLRRLLMSGSISDEIDRSTDLLHGFLSKPFELEEIRHQLACAIGD